MSALVLTVLICLAWAGMAALGYLRGGWREIVTLAAILLAYAVASEWAAPNGRDLAGLFGGNTYRSTTTIGLAYLFGGVALFGYFGGSRLPRPIPLSATERFVGGAAGLLNGGVLAALALRIVRSSAFGPGDGTVLQDTTLARVLIADIGYLLLIGLLVAAIAPFLSLLLVRQPLYTAEYAEDPMLQQSPVFGYFDTRDSGTVQPAPPPIYAPQYGPPTASEASAQYLPGLAPDPAFAPPGNVTAAMPPVMERTHEDASGALIPTTPMLPRAVSVPTWPTPFLPAIVTTTTTTTNGESGKDAPVVAAPSASAQSAQPVLIGPPGFAITASQPLPVMNDAPSNAPVTASTPAAMASPTPPKPPTLPASAVGPAPFTATRAAEEPPMARGNEPSETHKAAPVAVSTPVPVPDAVTDAGRATAPAGPLLAPPMSDARPTAPGLIPAAPLLPRVPEMPDTTNLTPFFAQPPAVTAAAAPVADATDVPAPSATRARIARARIATPRSPEAPAPPMTDTGYPRTTNGPMSAASPALQRPVQPGPNMHPCPVCDYPVRNGARFCPNCGSSQPPA